MMIVNGFPKLKNGNYVVDVHGVFEHYFDAVVPHQMLHRYKNFWGAELLIIQYGPFEPRIENVGNKPIKEKIFEYISNTPKTLNEINKSLRDDGYNTGLDTNIKAFIYKLKAEDRVVTEYDNKVMTVKLP